MSIEEIKAMPVVEIADENAILWLWTTNAHLRAAFEVQVRHCGLDALYSM